MVLVVQMISHKVLRNRLSCYGNVHRQRLKTPLQFTSLYKLSTLYVVFHPRSHLLVLGKNKRLLCTPCDMSLVMKSLVYSMYLAFGQPR